MILGLAVAYFIALVVLHALVMRVPLRGSSPLKFLGCGMLLGLALAIHGYFLGGIQFSWLAGLTLYACACELYLFLFTMITTSISANILRLLLNGNYSAEEISKLYQPEEMVRRRLLRLQSTGLIVQSGHHLTLTNKGIRLISIFGVLRRFFRHPDPIIPEIKRAA